MAPGQNFPNEIFDQLVKILTLSRRSSKSRSLICKSVSMDWFLYFRDFCHERVKTG